MLRGQKKKVKLERFETDDKPQLKLPSIHPRGSMQNTPQNEQSQKEHGIIPNMVD